MPAKKGNDKFDLRFNLGLFSAMVVKNPCLAWQAYHRQAAIETSD